MIKKYFFPFVLLIILFLSACSNPAPVNVSPDRKLKNGDRFNELLQKGDREFEKMHWIGWSNSIRIFKEALKIRNSEAAREKIFFALLLRAVRARFFFLSGETDLNRAGQILSEMGADTGNRTLFLRITRMYLFPDEPYAFSEKDLELLRSDISEDFKYYFFILHQRRKLNLQPYRKEVLKMLELFPGSNLKYFMRDKFIEIDNGIREHPDFIELLITKAERFFSTGNFKKAEEYYFRALEYDKKISVALTGLGNIYNHFELYEKALIYYKSSAEVTPLYYKALFGQAVCFSQLGKYKDSIQVLNKMLENDLWYKGEVYYYRAFNHFLLKEYSTVEEDLKNSENFIPDSIELHTLSGMFFYETKKHSRARKSFKKAVSINKQYPRPYYYLGYLDIYDKDIKGSLQNFLLAGIYYIEVIDRSIHNLNNIDDLNISDSQKNIIKSRRRERIRLKISEIITKMNNVIGMFKHLKKEKLKSLFRIRDNLRLRLPEIEHDSAGDEK